MAGLAGLEPMPRKRALLTLRAVNSVNSEFGAKITASVIAINPESVMVFDVTAVTLPGTFLTSVASFSAVTMTVGRVTLGVWDWAKDADEIRSSTSKAGRFSNIPPLCPDRGATNGVTNFLLYYRNGSNILP